MMTEILARCPAFAIAIVYAEQLGRARKSRIGIIIVIRGKSGNKRACFAPASEKKGRRRSGKSFSQSLSSGSEHYALMGSLWFSSPPRIVTIIPKFGFAIAKRSEQVSESLWFIHSGIKLRRKELSLPYPGL